MKKLFSAVLAAALCLMIPVSAAAAGIDEMTSRESLFVAEVERKVADVLVAVELQKDDFGLENVDFSRLALGHEFPSYELTENGLVLIEDIHYFPILDNDTWVATAVVSYSAYGDMNVEVSTKYADDYLTLTRTSAARASGAAIGVALVFDSTNAYLYSDGDRVLVESFAEMPGREKVSTYAGEISPATVQVAANRAIAVPQFMPGQGAAQGYSANASQDFVSLDVKPIGQPTKETCWAACTAMLLNYRGTSATVASVVSAADKTTSDYLDAISCSYLISNTYGYPCGAWGQQDGSYKYKLTLDNLITELYFLSSPMYAGFQPAPGDSIGHAVVISGYVNHGETPTMTFVDPDDVRIKAAAIPSNGAITITYGGSTHPFNTAFAVYE